MILYLRASLFLFLPYFFSFFLFLALCIVTCVYMLCICLESSCFPGQSNHMSLWVTYSQVLAFAFKSSLSDIKTVMLGASLMAQWLRLHSSMAGGMGWIPEWGSSTHWAVWPRKKKKDISFHFLVFVKYAFFFTLLLLNLL